jgi:hypothetical protein
VKKAMSLRSALFASLLLLPLVAVEPACAADPKVDSAWVNVRGAVFEVNARTVFPADGRVRTALESGVTIDFELQAVVEKENRYWLNTTLVDVILRRSLAWNALAQRYLLKDEHSGQQRSFITLDEALLAAGEVVDWPVVVEPQLDPQATYSIRLRAGYRRGGLPASLTVLMPWSDGWNRRSKWYTWTLPR